MVKDSTIQIQFNGKLMDVPPGASIADLLDSAEMRSKLVAVERNLEIVPREMHAETIVAPGDVIEAVTLVGGG